MGKNEAKAEHKQPFSNGISISSGSKILLNNSAEGLTPASVSPADFALPPGSASHKVAGPTL
jgi:hypothetical protein